MSPNNQKVKLLLFDLDGTLLNDQHEINPSSLEAIEIAKSSGYYVSIVTGRSYSQSKQYFELVQPNQYNITCSGNVLYDFKNHKAISITPGLDKAFKKALLLYLSENKVNFIAFSLNQNYLFLYSNDLSKLSIIKELSQDAIVVPALEKQLLLDYFKSIDVFYFTCFATEFDFGDLVEFIEKYQSEREVPVFNYTKWNNNSVDIFPYGTNKYVGFKTFLKLVRADLDNTHYFGDSLNDLEMFKHLKNTYALSNARVEVKNYAKKIIGSNNSDTIAETIYQIISRN